MSILKTFEAEIIKITKNIQSKSQKEYKVHVGICVYYIAKFLTLAMRRLPQLAPAGVNGLTSFSKSREAINTKTTLWLCMVLSFYHLQVKMKYSARIRFIAVVSCSG